MLRVNSQNYNDGGRVVVKSGQILGVLRRDAALSVLARPGKKKSTLATRARKEVMPVLTLDLKLHNKGKGVQIKHTY